MSNHMKPCKTCKHYSKAEFGPSTCARTITITKLYDPVTGPWTHTYIKTCESQRGAYGACQGDYWEPSLWERFKAYVSKQMRCGN